MDRYSLNYLLKITANNGSAPLQSRRGNLYAAGKNPVKCARLFLLSILSLCEHEIGESKWISGITFGLIKIKVDFIKIRFKTFRIWSAK